MPYLASNSATGVAASDNVTVSGAGFAGASTIILGVMVPFPGQTATFPGGFTQFASASNSGGGRGNAANMLFAFGNTVSGSYLLHIGGGGGTTPIGFAVAHTGRVITAPSNFIVSSNVNGGNSPFSIALAGLTAAAGDDLIWIGCPNWCPAATSWAFTSPGGYTSRQNISFAGAAGCAFDLETLDNQGGATGTITGIGTNAGATGGSDALGLVIALSAIGGPAAVSSLSASGLGPG